MTIPGNNAGSGSLHINNSSGHAIYANGGTYGFYILGDAGGLVCDGLMSGYGITATGNDGTATGISTFEPSSDKVYLADGAHGGAAATLTLLSAAITNSAGSALTLTSSGGDGHGLVCAGNGSGEGISATGGQTGNGITATGGATSGDGIRATATDGDGMQLVGGTNGSGLNCDGAGSGEGIDATGGATGNGIEAKGGVTSGSGLVAQAVNAGNGITAIGDGNGHGLSVTGQGSGDGLLATAGASGYDIDGDIHGTVDSVTTLTNPVTLANGAHGGAAASITLADYSAFKATGFLTTLGTNAPSGWLNADAFAASSLNGKGDWLLSSGYTAPDNANIVNIHNIVKGGGTGDAAAIKVVTDKLGTAVVQDGAVYDFTAEALAAAPTGGSAPTVTQIRQEMDSNSTKLANLDATVSSRAAASTALSTATWTNTKAGYLDAAVSSIGGAIGVGAYTITCTITQSDGSTVIEGAQVWLTSDSAGTTPSRGPLATNASGIAVFNAAAGTYYGWASAGGENFATTAVTITVTDANVAQTISATSEASIAGTDLALSAGAMCDRIEALTGNTTAGNALQHLNDGYRVYLAGYDPRNPLGKPHVWSFLRPDGEVVLWSSLTATAGTTVTGVTSADSSTVTANTASFYPTMVGKSIVITDAGTFTITAYTSSTVITVSGDATCSGKTFAITADGDYQLPDDFGGMVDNEPVYCYLEDDEGPELTEVTPKEIYERRRGDDTEDTDDAIVYATRVRAITSGKQKWDIMVNPIPDTTRTVKYRYLRLAEPLTDTAACYPHGSPDHSLTVLELGLARAEEITGHTKGIHQALADRYMATSIDRDNSLYGCADADERMGD